MRGPGTGRTVALAGSATLAVASVLLATTHPGGPLQPWLVLLVVAELTLCLRLAALATVLGVRRRDPGGPAAQAGHEAEVLAVAAHTSIAVICAGEALPAVRVAVTAALAEAPAERVLLVCGERRAAPAARAAGDPLEDLARRHALRLVRSDGSWWGGVRVAVASARTAHVVLTSAGDALLPGALRRLARAVAGDDVAAFAQPAAVPDAGARGWAKVRALVAARADTLGAAWWEGRSSLVETAAFRRLPLAAGPDAASVALQRAGRGGRWLAEPVAVRHDHPTPAPEAVPGRWALAGAIGRGTTFAQRVVHVQRTMDALAPAALLTGTGAAGAVLLLPATAPVWPSLALLAMLAVAHVAAALGRWWVSGGELVPGAGAVDAAARLRPRWLLGVATVVLDVTLVHRALHTAGRAAGPRTADLVAIAGGVLALVAVLAGGGVLHRFRPPSLPAALPVRARVGDRTLPVVGLDAASCEVALERPVELLGVATVRLIPDARVLGERREVQLRVQVVRVRELGGWHVATLRLVGEDLAGSHADHVGLWTAVAAAQVRAARPAARAPRGRRPRLPAVRAAGGRRIRLASAAALTCVAAALVPLPGGAAAMRAEIPGAPEARAGASRLDDGTRADGEADDASDAVADSASAPASAALRVVEGPAAAAAPADATTPDDDQAAGGTVAAAAPAPVRPTVTVELRTGEGGPTGTATLGQPFTWIAEVRNLTPAVADADGSATAPGTVAGVDLALELPPNWSYLATTALSPARCDTAPIVAPVDEVQTVTWTDMCALAPGEVLTLTVAAVAQAAAVELPGLAVEGRPVAHRAQLRLSADDGTTPLGTARATATAVLRSADLTLRLTDGGADGADDDVSHFMAVGSTGRYRVDVGNRGPDTATGTITATLAVPAGVDVVAAAGAGWACDAPRIGPVVCTHPGPLAAGAVLPAVTVAVQPTSAALAVPDGAEEGAVPTVGAFAAVSGAVADPRPDNDVDLEGTVVRPAGGTGEALLSVRATDGGVEAPAGGTAGYDVVVSNQGAGATEGPLVVTGRTGAAFVPRDVAGDGWRCQIGAGASAKVWTCTWVGDGAVGPGVTLAPITVTGGLGAASAATLTHDLSATAGSSAAATASLTMRVAPRAALVPALTSRPDAWPSGGLGTLSVSVANTGPSPEPGPVVAVVEVADGAVVEAATGQGWDCRVAAGRAGGDSVVTCISLAGAASSVLLPAGQALPPIDLSVRAGDRAVTSRVTVSGTTAGAVRPVTGRVPVGPVADLSVARTAEPWRPRVGATGQLGWTIANAGPSTASQLAAEVTIPAGMGLTGVSEGWSCTAPAEPAAVATTATCATPAPLGPGERRQLVVELEVTAAARAGGVTAVAGLAATSAATDPTPQDATAPARSIVTTATGITPRDLSAEAPAPDVARDAAATAADGHTGAAAPATAGSRVAVHERSVWRSAGGTAMAVALLATAMLLVAGGSRRRLPSLAGG